MKAFEQAIGTESFTRIGLQKATKGVSSWTTLGGRSKDIQHAGRYGWSAITALDGAQIQVGEMGVSAVELAGGALDMYNLGCSTSGGQSNGLRLGLVATSEERDALRFGRLMGWEVWSCCRTPIRR